MKTYTVIVILIVWTVLFYITDFSTFERWNIFALFMIYHSILNLPTKGDT